MFEWAGGGQRKRRKRALSWSKTCASAQKPGQGPRGALKLEKHAYEIKDYYQDEASEAHTLRGDCTSGL